MTVMMTSRPRLLCAILLGLGLLGGCAVGPAYKVPTTPRPAAFKEAGPWQLAAPADTLDKGPWWTLFNDPKLNDLAARVKVDNQNVAAAVANYAAARATVAQQRAQLLPTVTLNTSADRSGGGGSGGGNNKSYRLSIGGTWEPDVWGRLRAGVTGAEANAQASAADLAAATLSAQGELAINYFNIREIDAERDLVKQTIEGYQRVLQITQNRFDAGIAAKTDVLQAQTQLAQTRTDALGLERQRAQLEHAIAILLGRAPADFSLAVAPWTVNVPAVPAGVPSALLQRRPDIASAGRHRPAGSRRRALPPDRADGLRRRRRPAVRHPHPRPAAAAAPPGLRRRQPGRDPDPQPLQGGPGQLHRGGAGPGHRPVGPPRAGAVAGGAADDGGGLDTVAGWWLA